MSHIGDSNGGIYLGPHYDFGNLLSLVLSLGHWDVFLFRFHLDAFSD